MGADFYETGAAEAGSMGLVDSFISWKPNVGNIGCTNNFGGTRHNDRFLQGCLEAVERSRLWGRRERHLAL
jgi:hypothetical protein